MKYIQIDINTTENGIELILAELLNIGITDAVVTDPRDIYDLLDKKNEYDWDYVDSSVLDLKNQTPKVTLYFEDNDSCASKIEELKLAMDFLKQKVSMGEFGEGIDIGELKLDINAHDDSEWKDNWKAYFKPKKISDSIVVKPTWEEYHKKDGEKVLEIDPGMAFGTGTHETTSLCIKMLEKYQTPSDKVLDVGCGSGILSIASAMLGANNVLGIEIDPVAVEISKENVKLNNVQDIVSIKQGDLTKGISYKANLVVANLMADLVMMLTADIKKHLENGGIYISSGILDEKVDKVADCIKGFGFEIVEIVKDGMWCVIVARA